MEKSIRKQLMVAALAMLMTIVFMPLLTFSIVNAEDQEVYSGQTENISGKTYTISNADQLKTLSERVNEGITYDGVTFKLTKDIDLNNENFTPIGTGYWKIKSQAFKGIFDGCGYKISGLKVNPTEEELQTDSTAKHVKDTSGSYDHDYLKLSSKGLFGLVQGGTVKNLTIDGAEINGYNAEAAAVGTLNGGTVSAVTVKNSTINGKYENAGAVVGRAFGGAYGKVTVTNCVVDNCKVILPTDHEYENAAGGVIGRTQSDSGSAITGNKVTNTTVKAYRKAAGLVGCILMPTSVELTSNNIDADITINEEAENKAGRPYYGIITAEIQGTAGKRGFESYDGKNITIDWVNTNGESTTAPESNSVTTEKDGAKANTGKIKATVGTETAVVYAGSDSRAVQIIADLQKKISDLNDEIDQLKADSTEQINELKTQLDSAEAALETAQKQVSELSTKLDQAQKDNADKIADLQTQLDSTKLDLEKANNQISALSAELEETKNASTAKDNDLQKQLDRLKADLEKAQKQISALTAPGKVTNLKAKAGSKKITLTWKKVSKATGYKVYRASKKNGKYKYVRTVKSTKYVNSKLKKGKKYYYKVRAYKEDANLNADLFGKYSKVVSAKVK